MRFRLHLVSALMAHRAIVSNRDERNFKWPADISLCLDTVGHGTENQPVSCNCCGETVDSRLLTCSA